CLVNDQPVTVSGLKRLGETLVEVHGQHDQRSLRDMSLHRALLNDYARLSGMRKSVAGRYHQSRTQAQGVGARGGEIEKNNREQEYLQHMRNELKQLAPQVGEEETLATQRTTLMQGEKRFSVLNEAIGELGQGRGVVASLRNAQRTLTRSAFGVQ